MVVSTAMLCSTFRRTTTREEPMRTILAAASLAAALLGITPATAADNRALPPGVPAPPATNLAHHGYFYVGGHYQGAPGSDVMAGQIYVEVWVPAAVRRP